MYHEYHYEIVFQLKKFSRVYMDETEEQDVTVEENEEIIPVEENKENMEENKEEKENKEENKEKNKEENKEDENVTLVVKTDKVSPEIVDPKKNLQKDYLQSHLS